MASRRTFVAASIAASLALASWTPQSPRDEEEEDEGPPPEVFASDDELAAAGRIPAGTGEDATALWKAMANALAKNARDAKDTRPTSFELTFSVRNRAESGTQDFDARFAYLDVEGGLVRGTTLDGQGEVVQVQMRGIDEKNRRRYWYRKFKGSGATEDWVRLTARDHKEDRHQIDNWAAISYDIARLIDPNSMRIVRLRTRALAKDTDFAKGYLHFEGDAGIVLPRTDVAGVIDGARKKLSQLASELVWLQLDTPDFELFAGEGESRSRARVRTTVRRLLFGLHPTTKEPQIVIVSPDPSGPLQVPGTVLVQATDWLDHGEGEAKSRLPGRFFAYETPLPAEDQRAGLRFSDAAIADLYLLEGGGVNVPLERKDFVRQ